MGRDEKIEAWGKTTCRKVGLVTCGGWPCEEKWRRYQISARRRGRRDREVGCFGPEGGLPEGPRRRSYCRSLTDTTSRLGKFDGSPRSPSITMFYSTWTLLITYVSGLSIHFQHYLCMNQLLSYQGIVIDWLISIQSIFFFQSYNTIHFTELLSVQNPKM